MRKMAWLAAVRRSMTRLSRRTLWLVRSNDVFFLPATREVPTEEDSHHFPLTQGGSSSSSSAAGATPAGAVPLGGGALSAEAQAPKTRPSPLIPTDLERRQHCLTHLPFRDWCK